MEKQTTKSINKIFKLLPKVSQAAVSFQNPHFSPGKDHHHNKRFNNSHLNKGFSGTIIPFIPIEARSKSKNNDESTDHEPTSPKISCMGQIKHKHKMCKTKQRKLLTKSVSYLNPRQKSISQNDKSNDSKKTKTNSINNMFGSSSKTKSDASANDYKPPLPDRAPSLSQMKRFASSRDELETFNWTTARIAVEDNCRGHDFSDDDDEVIISFSAPMIAVKPVRCGSDQVGGFEPRKEINLWKRRTMAQPKPLQMDMVRLRSRN